MICKCCGSVLNEHGNYCMKCGTKIERTQVNVCSVCGKPMPPDMVFCGYCGNCLYDDPVTGMAGGTNKTAATQGQQAPSYVISTPPEEESRFKKWVTALVVTAVVLIWIGILMFMLAYGEVRKEIGLRNKLETRKKSDVTAVVKEIEMSTAGTEDKESSDGSDDRDTSSETEESKAGGRLNIWSGRDS